MNTMKLLLTLLLVSAAMFTYADKKKNAKYIEKRTEAISDMYSLLKGDPELMMVIADKKCKEFKYDLELMRSIASGFYSAGYIEKAFQRYQQIKQMYPNDFYSYSCYAASLFEYSIKHNSNGVLIRDTIIFNLAKAQMDSAKVAFPQSKEPYRWWLSECAPYICNDVLLSSFQDEVEAFRKAFPNENADYVAANILNSYRFEAKTIWGDKIPDYVYLPDVEEDDYFPERQRYYEELEFRRSNLARECYEKVDISGLQADELCELAYFYYKSTESKYIDREGRAQLHEKGLERAHMGVEKYPEEINFCRFQLWHAAELAKTYDIRINQAKRNKDADLQAKETKNRNTAIAQGLIGADNLMSKTDTLLHQDYYYTAVLNQLKGNYSVAIKNYQKAMGAMPYYKFVRLPYKTPYHNCDSLTIYQNLSDCYGSIKEYEKAIVQLKALFELREGHGGQLKRTDLLDLIRIYRSWGNDTTKTQKERFAAYVAVDSLYAIIQDSIDAHNKLFDNLAEGYVGMYPMLRMTVRTSMNTLSDYRDRENYQLLEIAEDIYRRIDPLPEKSEKEISWIGSALRTMWSEYYRQEDYENAWKYFNLELNYNPSIKETYGSFFEDLKKKVRKQR